MPTPRELIRRAVAAAGMGVVASVLPRAVPNAAAVDRIAQTPAPTGRLLIRTCVFRRGDPSLNDPDWIESDGPDVLIRDRELFIDGPLMLPNASATNVIDCLFDGNGIVVSSAYSRVTGCIIRPAPGEHGIHVLPGAANAALIDNAIHDGAGMFEVIPSKRSPGSAFAPMDAFA